MGGSWLRRACRRLIDHEGRPKDRTSRQIHRFIHKKGRLGTSIAALETTASKRPFTFNRSSAKTKSPYEHRLRSARTPLLIKPAHECLLFAQSGHFAIEFQCQLLGVKRTLRRRTVM